jgi:hypothetical protein
MYVATNQQSYIYTYIIHNVIWSWLICMSNFQYFVLVANAYTDQLDSANRYANNFFRADYFSLRFNFALHVTYVNTAWFIHGSTSYTLRYSFRDLFVQFAP